MLQIQLIPVCEASSIVTTTQDQTQVNQIYMFRREQCRFLFGVFENGTGFNATEPPNPHCNTSLATTKQTGLASLADIFIYTMLLFPVCIDTN